MSTKSKRLKTNTSPELEPDEHSLVIKDVIQAANGLPLTAFFQLRDTLDEIEERKGRDFLEQLPKQNRPQGITDDMVDAIVIRNRRRQRRQHRTALINGMPWVE